MRNKILFLTLLIIGLTLQGKAQEAKKDSTATVSDTLQVHLSQWQGQQLAAIDENLKSLEEQHRTLEARKETVVLAICDINKVDVSKIQNLQYEKDKMVIVVTKTIQVVPDKTKKPKR